MTSFVSMESQGVVQALCDAVVAARLEVIAFSFAVAIYSILAAKRIPQQKPFQQKAKLQTDPPSQRKPPPEQAGAKSRNPTDVDLRKYVVMIRKCASEKDLKGAEGIFESLKDHGVATSSVIYNTMIDACVTCQDLQAAHSWMEQARQAGMIDVATFNTMVKAHLMNNDFETARRIVREMKAAGMQPDHVTMNELVNAGTSQTFGRLIKSCGQARDLQGVWRNWKEMRAQLVKPSSVTLGCMVEALQNNASTEDAFDLVQQLQEDPQCRGGINSVIYCSILKGFAREKKLERVWDVYQEMQRRQVEMTLVTFNTVLDACARVGRMEHAARIMQDMKKYNVEPNIISYSTMLKGHCQVGDIDHAFSILKLMREHTSLKPDEIMYNSLIDGCAQHSLYTEGMQVFDDMIQDGVRPSNFTLSSLVKLMNRTRRVDEAFSIVRKMAETYGIKPNAYVYTNLIQACVSNSYHDRAISVLDTMIKERVQPDQRTYGVLIRASLSQNHIEQAAALLRTALGLPGSFEDLTDSKFAACPSVDSSFVNDTLSRLSERGSLQNIVAPLLADLKKSKHRLYIDPAIQRRVTGCFR